MPLPVVILRSAEHDLAELRGYISKRFGHAIWRATYAKIVETVFTLGDFPLQGSVPNELQKLNMTRYRQVMSGKNRIIYEVRQETVFVHIICDSRRDMRALLKRRLST